MQPDLQFPAAPHPDSYAFLPVWQRIALQLVVISLICCLCVLVGEVLRPSFDPRLNQVFGLALVFLPPVAWLWLSVWPEFRYARPRRRLISVAVVSGLTASAIGLPLVEVFFAVDQWLPLQSVFQRIVGYTVTAGVVGVGLQFVVLRYLIYPQGLRVRGDAVAYSIASAVGYSFYLNLVTIWSAQPTWDVAAILILANITIYYSSSLFISLGIIESFFSDAIPTVLPFNLLIAAIILGAATALYPGMLSGSLSQAGNADRPAFGLVMLIVTWLAALFVSYFLYANSERREREAYGSREDIHGI